MTSHTCAVLFCFVIAMQGVAQPRDYYATNPAELEEAISAAMPGETIVIGNGTWKDLSIQFDSEGAPGDTIAAGHLLYGLGWAYDLLYHDLNEAERIKYRDKLIRQARILFDYYDIQRGRSYSYSQNHVFIPMAGLAPSNASGRATPLKL